MCNLDGLIAAAYGTGVVGNGSAGGALLAGKHNDAETLGHGGTAGALVRGQRQTHIKKQKVSARAIKKETVSRAKLNRW